MAARAPPRGQPVNASQLVNATQPEKGQSMGPNQTLYVTNLPSSKIQKADLRTSLYLLFSTYGAVLDIVALKTMSMRGQAHIVFRDVQTSTKAMRHLDGQMFLGRPIKIQYAKSKSNFIAKLDGTFRVAGKTGATTVEQTELQRSIFDGPVPGATTAAKPTDQVMTDAGEAESRGQKRTRDEEEEDSDEDVAMEEDSDSDE